MSELRDKNLELYNKIVETHPEIVRKGKTMPYTSSNGYMFSQLNKDGEVGIRLPKEAQQAFMEKHNTGEFRSYGAMLRGYVTIPNDLLNDLELMVSTLDEGYRYVNSLPPNPTKK